MQKDVNDMRRVEDRQVRVAFVNDKYEQEEEAFMPMPTHPSRPEYPSMHTFFKDMAKEQHVGLGVLCFQLLYEYYLIATNQPNRGFWKQIIEETIDKTLEQREQKNVLYPLPKKKERNEQSSSLQQNKNPQEKEEKQ